MQTKNALLLGVSLALLSTAPAGRAQTTVVLPQQRQVTVTGEADVKVVPDEVVLTLGLETSDADLAKAKSLNNERLKGVQTLAAQYKLPPRDVQADYISIEPSYDRKKFNVRRRVVVTLRQLNLFEEVLTHMVQNNRANSVQGIQFRTSQLRKYRDQARELAIKAAREKATALAAALDSKIGKPLSITENYNGWSSWYQPYWGGSYGGYAGNAQVMVSSPARGGESADSIASPGQISVSASVTVGFELQ